MKNYGIVYLYFQRAKSLKTLVFIHMSEFVRKVRTRSYYTLLNGSATTHTT